MRSTIGERDPVWNNPSLPKSVAPHFRQYYRMIHPYQNRYPCIEKEHSGKHGERAGHPLLDVIRRAAHDLVVPRLGWRSEGGRFHVARLNVV